MNELERLIQKVYNLKELTNKNYKPNLIREYARFVSLQIKQKYFILPPTKNNIEAVSQIKNIFPNIKIIEEYEVEGRESIDMEKLITKSIKEKKSVEELISYLKLNTIILKRDENLYDFIDAMQISSKLIDDKKYTLREITYSNGRSQRYHAFNNGLCKLLSKRYKDVFNAGASIDGFVINNKTVTITMQLKGHLGFELTEYHFSSQKSLEKLKKEVKKLSIDIINSELPLNNSSIQLNSVTITTPKGLNYSNSHGLYKSRIMTKKAYNIKNANEFESKVNIRGIQINQFIDFIDSLLNNEDIQNKTIKTEV